MALPPCPALSPIRAAPSRPGALTPRLSVVIVNYCQWRDTVRLVRQLLAANCARRGAAEIVVVDNHSPPHPVLRWLRRQPGVSMRRWGRNRGFACAANEGFRLSRGSWLLLLNPDMTVPAGFLDDVFALTERWQEQKPRAGILGLQLRHTDGSLQLSAGPFPTLAGTLARLALPRAWRKYSFHGSRRARPVPWVTGCCLLLRHDCFMDLGGFDRNFFLYYEDVDLCQRAWARGWSVWYEPAVSLIHHQPLHTRAVPTHLRLITRHALLTYAAKHWPQWQLWLLAGIVRGEAWLQERRAQRRRDETTAGIFHELGELAADLARQRRQAARHRLKEVVRQEEERLGRIAVDRHSQPQPSRIAEGVPRQRQPAGAARDRDRGS